MDEPRKAKQAVTGCYALMERAGWYRMNYTPADAAHALCGPFGMCIPEERQRNISQARDLAAYFLEVAAHLEHPGLRVEE